MKFTLLLGLIVVLQTHTTSNNEHVWTSRDLSNWMANVSNHTLRQLTLPGTHDSASYNLTGTLMEEPQWIEWLVWVAEKMSKDVTEIIDDWGKSQDRSIFGQLLGGIRHIDLRACNYNGTWHVHHGPLLGLPLQVSMNDIRKFLLGHEQEVIIVELTHFGTNAPHPNTTEVDELVRIIKSTWGEFLMPHSVGLDVPLSKLVAAGQRLLLTFEGPADPLFWPENTIANSYADSDKLPKMEAYNDAEVSKWNKSRASYTNQLFKIAWTLTPNSKTIIDTPLPHHPHTLLELADIANKDLDRWSSAKLKEYHTYPIFGNILYIDHFETTDIVKLVTKMNAIEWS